MKGPTGSQGLGPLVPLTFMSLGMGAKSASPDTWSCTHDLCPSRGWVLVGTVGADEPFAGHKESWHFTPKTTPHINPPGVGSKQQPRPGLEHLAGFKVHSWRARPPHADVGKHYQALAWCCSGLVIPDRLCAPFGPPWDSLSYCSLKCGYWACGPKHLADLVGCWAAPQGCHPPAPHGPSRTSCSGVRWAEKGRKQSP